MMSLNLGPPTQWQELSPMFGLGGHHLARPTISPLPRIRRQCGNPLHTLLYIRQPEPTGTISPLLHTVPRCQSLPSKWRPTSRARLITPVLLWRRCALSNDTLGSFHLLHPLLHLTQTQPTGAIPPHPGSRQYKVSTADLAFSFWELTWSVRVIALFGELDRSFVVVGRDVSST
jgi:hypothetical protein